MSNYHWNILLAEDDHGLNRLISKKLEKEGFSVTGVFTGREAVDSIEQKMPDLLLLDYQMPVMGGKETVAEMKDKGISVPFIIVTGHGDERVAVEMMKEGAMDYLVKDADFHNILIEKVKNALHHLETVKELGRSKSIIKESEARFKLITENSVDIIWQMDLRMKFTYVSKSSIRILGYEPHEIQGRHLWEFARRKDFFNMARVALNAIRDYKNFTFIVFESYMIRKDGRILPVEITGKLYKDVDGKVIGLQGSTKDISEQKKIRDQLTYQNNLINTLMNNIPDVIYVKDTESKYLINNIGHINELGANSQEELLGKSDYDFFDKEMADEFRSDEVRVLENGESIINKEEYHTLRDGRHKWTLTTKVPLRDHSNMIIGLAGVNRDITKRKEQEDEIIRSRYELALKNKIANIFLNNDYNLLFKKLLQTFLNELNGKVGFIGFLSKKGDLVIPAMTENIKNFEGVSHTDSNIVPPDKFGGIWSRAMLDKKSFVKNENLNLPNTHYAIRNALSVPIVLADRSIGVITIADKIGGFSKYDVKLLEDISSYMAPIMDAMLKEQSLREEKEEAFLELQLAKDKAEESDKLKSAFLLNLSHELRTPLNSIIGFTNIIANQNKEDERTRRFASLIDLAGQDLIKMVDDTIDISRLENNEFKYDTSTTDLISLLDELYRDFKKYYSGKYPDLEFSFEKQHERLTVNVDHQKFKKAITKLLDNAGKFTEKGSVNIRYELKGDTVDLQIIDTGIGIPKELTEAVFEKFRKIVDKNVLYRGNGLGLSIAKGLLEAMHCNIFIESQIGEGTKVSIQIPLT